MDISALIIKKIAETRPDEPRQYIGASSIGKKCNRAIWYGFKGTESSSLSPNIRIAFDIGKRLESLLLHYMEDAGLIIIHANDRNKYLWFKDSSLDVFQGHADALLHHDEIGTCILEIKTARSSSFAVFKKK